MNMQTNSSYSTIFDIKSNLMIDLRLPEKLFEPLFRDLALSGLMADGKTIADAIPLRPVEDILRDYEKEKKQRAFDLRAFFEQNFRTGELKMTEFVSDLSQPLTEHIHRLWPYLTRKGDIATEGSSLIPLPFPYVVPGGRFNEIYYWDSYFTMLGLEAEGLVDMIENMVDNFSWLIEQTGFIPNGNRSYFLSRSQPPFFSLMVQLLAKNMGENMLIKYLPALKKEYAFWMEDASDTSGTIGHRVQVDEGFLNRYWDCLDTPRSEMYADDVHLLSKSVTPASLLCRHLRSACESGWDFSSRWFIDGQNLESIHTADILPVDLNSLLYHLEATLAYASELAGYNSDSDLYHSAAIQRQNLINKYFWNEADGYYYDFDFINGHQTKVQHAAGVFPLSFGLASEEQAARSLAFMEGHLLAAHGILTTAKTTGQQWDAPNGWAPLQWMALRAADQYNHTELACLIASRWTSLNEQVFRTTGKMMEKYNVVESDVPGGGGEYPVQDGFGWSNGVYLAMKNYLASNRL